MSVAARRKRDPEGRRQAIVVAAAELVTEVGVEAITHRLVAARADVPLGATTQYFDTLDDLRDAALQLLVAHVDQQMTATRETLAVQGATAQSVATLIHAALVDATSMKADRAVVTAAVHDPRLRAMARRWSGQIIDMLTPAHGIERATAAAVFIDGLLWHKQLNDEPVPLHIIETALAGIFGETRTPAD
ncbi:MAG: TetR/AcrR family transcriptional regulator [Microbacterium sp.]|uniref:TetR/AcrR family transcriptional regulator n=1 Tax=Microbacterium sp. TaxID=51671 RepID=UPI003A868470